MISSFGTGNIKHIETDSSLVEEGICHKCIELLSVRIVRAPCRQGIISREYFWKESVKPIDIATKISPGQKPFHSFRVIVSKIREMLFEELENFRPVDRDIIWFRKRTIPTANPVGVKRFEIIGRTLEST